MCRSGRQRLVDRDWRVGVGDRDWCVGLVDRDWRVGRQRLGDRDWRVGLVDIQAHIVHMNTHEHVQCRTQAQTPVCVCHECSQEP